MTGYCMKCKVKREIVEAQEVVMKNGRNAIKGKCSTCGGGMYRILGVKKAKSETMFPKETKVDYTNTPSKEKPSEDPYLQTK